MEEEKCDFISSLPSDILRRIISFIALEQAMKTSALSTVWRSLWVPVEVNLHEANREVKDIVDLFSKPYDSHQVWKLCLSFQDSKKAPSEMKGEIIALAAKGVDEELYLDFSERQKEQNTSDLVEVMLDLRNGSGPSEFDCEDVLSLLASLKDIEVLRVSGWLLEIDPNRGPLPCPYFHHYWHEPHLWMDYTSVMSNTSQLENLKVVEFMGYTNEEDQSLLIDLLLKKACLLESVTVTSPQHHSWKVAKIPDDQSQLNQTWQSSNQQKQNAVLSLIKFIIRIQNTLFTRIAPSHKNATP
ncbi:hypothetical protein QQP08_015702 [Theobroma cacao]|nr:hypothetical protein QQP08_015702 [Theobroma cacao]